MYLLRDLRPEVRDRGDERDPDRGAAVDPRAMRLGWNVKLRRTRQVASFDEVLARATEGAKVDGFDQSLVPDREWGQLVKDFFQGHDPYAVGGPYRGRKVGVLELEYVGAPAPMVTDSTGHGPGDWLDPL